MSQMPWTSTTLRRAMAENYEQPEGPARNARAELLLAEAEKLNVPLAVIEALGHQLKVYNYSSEKDKMFVPFARLLRMWDERPEDFDEYEIHSLHWVFKWMSAGMLDQPHIPLASIEKWLGEMEHRYRLAGHSERAVRSAEFSVAAHIGDLARAERAYAAWLAADRDTHGRLPRVRAARPGLVAGAAAARTPRPWSCGAPVAGGRVRVRPRAAHRPRVLPGAAAAPGPPGRGARPPPARLPAGPGHGEHARRVRGPRGVLRAHRQRGARPGAPGRAARVLHGLRGPAQQAGLHGRGGPADGPPRPNWASAIRRSPVRPAAPGPRANSPPTRARRPFPWPPASTSATARRTSASAPAQRMDRRAAGGPAAAGRALGTRRAAAPAPRPPAAAEPTGPPAAGTDLPALLAEARRLPDVAAARTPSRPGRRWRGPPRPRARSWTPATARRSPTTRRWAAGPEGRAALRTGGRAVRGGRATPGEALAARARGAYVRALTGAPRGGPGAIAELYERGARPVRGRRDGCAADGVRAGGPGADTGAAGARGPEDADTDAVARPPRRPYASCWLRRAALARGRAAGLAGRRGAGDARGAGGARRGRGDRRRTVRAGRGAVSWRPGCRGSRWSTRRGSPGSPSTSGDAGEAERAARAALEHGGPHLEPVGHAQLHLQLAEVLGADEQVGAGLRSTPWRRRTGPTRRARGRRSAPGPGISSAGSCCGRGGGPRRRRCWSRRCPI